MSTSPFASVGGDPRTSERDDALPLSFSQPGLLSSSQLSLPLSNDNNFTSNLLSAGSQAASVLHSAINLAGDRLLIDDEAQALTSLVFNSPSPPLTPRGHGRTTSSLSDFKVVSPAATPDLTDESQQFLRSASVRLSGSLPRSVPSSRPASASLANSVATPLSSHDDAVGVRVSEDNSFTRNRSFLSQFDHVHYDASSGSYPKVSAVSQPSEDPYASFGIGEIPGEVEFSDDDGMDMLFSQETLAPDRRIFE